jgi:hypothetical protein
MGQEKVDAAIESAYAMTNSAATAPQIPGSIAHVAHHGLKPIHSRATGNAKRLLQG